MPHSIAGGVRLRAHTIRIPRGFSIRNRFMNIQLTPTLLAKPLVAAFVLAGLVGVFTGLNAGCAALAGGLTAWLSQVYFAKHLRPAIQGNDKTFMRTFYPRGST